MNNMFIYSECAGWWVRAERPRFVKLGMGGPDKAVFRYELVQGLKRKIQVIFHDNVSNDLTSQDIQTAASVADKHGWKKVVIMTDYGMGDTLEIFNMHSFNTAWRDRGTGVFLKSIEDLPY